MLNITNRSNLAVPFSQFKGSSELSNNSAMRKNKLSGLELEYQDYIVQQQGIFVLRCQIMNKEFQKIQEMVNLEERMRS
jgi:hypothetical protein